MQVIIPHWDCVSLVLHCRIWNEKCLLKHMQCVLWEGREWISFCDQNERFNIKHLEWMQLSPQFNAHRASTRELSCVIITCRKHGLAEGHPADNSSMENTYFTQTRCRIQPLAAQFRRIQGTSGHIWFDIVFPCCFSFKWISKRLTTNVWDQGDDPTSHCKNKTKQRARWVISLTSSKTASYVLKGHLVA